MIPQQGPRSELSRAEWKAAFGRRYCFSCGKVILPAERTDNPSTARRILTCSKRCKSRRERLLIKAERERLVEETSRFSVK